MSDSSSISDKHPNNQPGRTRDIFDNKRQAFGLLWSRMPAFCCYQPSEMAAVIFPFIFVVIQGYPFILIESRQAFA